MNSEATQPEPLAYSINDAVRVSGLGRTTLYGLISKGEIKVRKVGARTLVPADSLRAFLSVQA